MTFTVRHGKKITMFKFGKHLFRLGASKNHGELLVITRGYPGLEHFLFFPIVGMMIQSDSYFSGELTPPTSIYPLVN